MDRRPRRRHPRRAECNSCSRPESDESHRYAPAWRIAERSLSLTATRLVALTVLACADFPILPRKIIEAYADEICLNGTAQRCEVRYRVCRCSRLPRGSIPALSRRICAPPVSHPHYSCTPAQASFGKGSQLLAILDVMMDEMFHKFPLLDGIIIRTGEHYIVDLSLIHI